MESTTLKRALGARGSNKGQSVPTVARGDFQKEEMLELSLGGVGIKPGEEKIREEKDILGRNSSICEDADVRNCMTHFA